MTWDESQMTAPPEPIDFSSADERERERDAGRQAYRKLMADPIIQAAREAIEAQLERIRRAGDLEAAQSREENGKR